jgi:hypothetical protein
MFFGLYDSRRELEDESEEMMFRAEEVDFKSSAKCR